MTNHPNRSKRRAIEAALAHASMIIASGSVTLVGDAAHDAGVLARYEAAHLLVDRAIMTNDGVWPDADDRRQLYRDCIASMRQRLAA